MNPVINYMEDIPVYTLDYPLLKLIATRYHIEPNSLSPLNHIVAYDSALADEFVQDEKTRILIKVIAQPHYKGFFQKAGAGYPLEVFEVYGAMIEGKPYFAYVDTYKKQLKVLLFCKARELSTYFVSRYAAMIAQKPENILPEKMTPDVFLYVLNILDMVKKNYLSGILKGVSESFDKISEESYNQMLENNMLSGDVRWLLPSALKLMPGIHEMRVNFQLGKIDFPDSFQFTKQVEDAPGHKQIVMSPDCKQLGIEYTHFWKYAIGFDFKKITHGDADYHRVMRGYFTPTDESNHLFLIDHNKVCDHESLSFNELLDSLEVMFEGLLN